MLQAEDGIRNVAVTGVQMCATSRRRHTRCSRDWSSDVCSSDLKEKMKWLIAFLLLTTSALAEEITTGNLLPNGTGSASNLQSVDTNIPNVQSSCSSFTSVNTTCTNQNWN